MLDLNYRPIMRTLRSKFHYFYEFLVILVETLAIVENQNGKAIKSWRTNIY